jgi:hypothetical protein
MIKCRFVFQFSGGGTSDSLNKFEEVLAVPRIGERISMINNEGVSSGISVVKDVIHWINAETGNHEIVVHYG